MLKNKRDIAKKDIPKKTRKHTNNDCFEIKNFSFGLDIKADKPKTKNQKKVTAQI